MAVLSDQRRSEFASLVAGKVWSLNAQSDGNLPAYEQSAYDQYLKLDPDFYLYPPENNILLAMKDPSILESFLNYLDQLFIDLEKEKTRALKMADIVDLATELLFDFLNEIKNNATQNVEEILEFIEEKSEFGEDLRKAMRWKLFPDSKLNKGRSLKLFTGA